MIFSSYTFILFFLPVVLIGYQLLFFSSFLQSTWLLLMSLLFYAWGEPIGVLILIASLIINYLLGLVIGTLSNKKSWASKGMLIAGAVVNVGALLVFKYAVSAFDALSNVLPVDLPWFPNLALPIGMSFYTLKALSYLIDVYRGDAPAQRNPVSLGLYMAFFPVLLAGPVESYHSVMLKQRDRKLNFEHFSTGTVRFAVGLAKKVLLATPLSVLTNTIFNLSNTGIEKYTMPVTMAWLGLICFTLQIYLDLSGYADMAIGLGNMFGLRIDENFDAPYHSASITEFWNKWNITLYGWFREYVYAPMRKKAGRNQDIVVRNMLLLWVLFGLWHGISWPFLLWGVYNCLFIILERVLGIAKSKNHCVVRHVYTVLAVMFGWLLFRVNNIGELRLYLINLFGTHNNPLWSPTVGMMLREYWAYLVGAVLCTLPTLEWIKERTASNKHLETASVCGGYLLLFLAAATAFAFLILNGSDPFIYFAI